MAAWELAVADRIQAHTLVEDLDLERLRIFRNFQYIGVYLQLMDQVADRKHLRKLVEHPLEEQHRDREPVERELPFVEDMRDSAALDFPFYHFFV